MELDNIEFEMPAKPGGEAAKFRITRAFGDDKGNLKSGQFMRSDLLPPIPAPASSAPAAPGE